MGNKPDVERGAQGTAQANDTRPPYAPVSPGIKRAMDFSISQ